MALVVALALGGCGLAVVVSAPAVMAHGAILEYRQVPGVAMLALYDNGQPMAEAAIIVYAPDQPTRPWLTGTTDKDGRFSFVPDPELPGTWAVQARQAGHGAMAHITIAAGTGSGSEAEGSAASSAPAAQAAMIQPAAAGLTTTQRWVMALAVTWGFIGTALFFSRRR